jgi:hypothetical protein
MWRRPFHSDEAPSLSLLPVRLLIEWVMKAEGVLYLHTVEILLTDCPSLSAGTSEKSPKRISSLKLSKVLEDEAGDGELYHARRRRLAWHQP